MKASEKFGIRLKALRREFNLTQRQLALMVGVSPQQISNYETGTCDNPTLSVMDKIAQGLGISLSELLDGVDSDPE